VRLSGAEIFSAANFTQFHVVSSVRALACWSRLQRTWNWLCSARVCSEVDEVVRLEDRPDSFKNCAKRRDHVPEDRLRAELVRDPGVAFGSAAKQVDGGGAPMTRPAEKQ